MNGSNTYVIRADFESSCGTWWAIGGGGTLAEAIAFAAGSLPAGCAWQLVGWRPVYGD